MHLNNRNFYLCIWDPCKMRTACINCLISFHGVKNLGVASSSGSGFHMRLQRRCHLGLQSCKGLNGTGGITARGLAY